MTPLILKYPLDLTGVNPNNLVLGEQHDLTRRKVRAVATNYGPFYTQGLKVYDTATGKPLIPGTPEEGGQYVAAELYEEASRRSAKEVCAIIVITDQTVSDSITIDYQVVGGEFSSAVPVIAQLIAALSLDDRPIKWADVLGKPSAFPPTKHLHDIGDVYGFEYLVDALERVRNAILMGDVASHDEIYRYIDHYIDDLTAQLNAQAGALNDHKNDHGNPHAVSKGQVGLGNVDNFATASQQEAEQGLANNLFMTPLRTYQAIDFIAGRALNAHLEDFTNPHHVTQFQVGLGNVDNFATASETEARNGTSSTRFMTPLGVAQAIATQASGPLNAHLADHENPHVVTKLQVGLGSVDNFATATPQQAAAGVSTTNFMTPAGVKAFADAQIWPTLNAHINNQSNPHGTTANQVGAYSQQQTNDLLAQRLPINGTAVNSSALGGQSFTQVLAAAYAQVGTMGKRNLYVSSADPSGGANGDVWLKY